MIAAIRSYLRNPQRPLFVLAIAAQLGMASPASWAAALYRCERAGQAPLFAAVPCSKGNGPGERLGDAVIQPPPARPLGQPPKARHRSENATAPERGRLPDA